MAGKTLVYIWVLNPFKPVSLREFLKKLGEYNLLLHKQSLPIRKT